MVIFIASGTLSCSISEFARNEAGGPINEQGVNVPSVEAQASVLENTLVPGSSAALIQSDVSWLAADAREGREAGSEGYLHAANYVAERFRDLGLKPGSGEDYFQDVALRIVSRDDNAAFMALTDVDGQTLTLTHKRDFLGGRSLQGEAFDVTAPLIFAGFGITAPSHNDYEGLDVEGKIVVVFAGAPDFLNSETSAHFSRTRTKSAIARDKGAVGLIVISRNSIDPFKAWERTRNRPERKRWTWVSPDGVAEDEALGMAPAFTVGPVAALSLFNGAPLSFEQVRELANTDPGKLKGFDLQGHVNVRGGGTIEDLMSPNVVGFLPGNDPALRDEVIVLSAHLDHVGIHESRYGGEDLIHNGALDNAMGISIMLDVARRMISEGAPRRSIIFLAVTAEEKGLIGSDYFAHYPTSNGKRIVANINLDMPLVLYPFTDVIAFGAKRSSLGETVRVAAQKTDVSIIDDPWPELQLFTRSDHYNFVRQGIPSVFLFLGTGNGGQEVFDNFLATHYHEPTDEIDLPIQWEHAARFANLNYLIASEVANASAAPSWKKGDFFAETFTNP